MFLAPLPRAHGEVLAEAVAVEPGLAAVDVANVDEVAVGVVLGTAVACGHKDVVVGVEAAVSSGVTL